VGKFGFSVRSAHPTWLHEAQKEMGGRNVPTIMLYGRVCEMVDISQQEFQALLNQMVGKI